jgi:WD40 repeat protein
MSLRKRRNLLATGLLAVPLTAALISHIHCNGNRSDELRGIALEGHTLPVQALALDPDGATLTTVACSLLNPSGQAEVIVWDTGTGLRRATRTVSLGELLTLTFAPGARTLAASGRDGTLRLWDTATWQEPQWLNQDRFLVSALAFSADGRQLAAADHLHVTLWNVATGRKTCCQGHDQRSCALAFAPGAQTLASGNEDTTIRLWDTATGVGRGTLQGHDRAVLTLAYSPDGRHLASGDFGGTVKLWDVDAAKDLATVAALGNEVAALAFSPDSRTLAVAVDRAVQLWDVATGQLVARLEGHEGQVKCLAFSTDGTRLASGGHDRRVRLWNVAQSRTRD